MIARMGKKRIIICAALILAACVGLAAFAIGLNLPEASGKTVKKDGKLTIDCSHMDQGYVMVKGKQSSKRLKVQVSTAGAKLNYDLNGDGDYGDSNDMRFTGHSYTPKLTAGLNLSMRYKNFDFYALLTGAFGFYLNWNTSVYNTTLVNQAQAIMRRIADDHYSSDNPDGKYPRLTYNKTMNNDLSGFYHYKGDYVKVKSLQLC